MKDPYLYPNSEVLQNLADIHDEQILKDMEADYTLSRLSDVVIDNSVRRFDFDGLCDLHHYIFQDVYDWAGKPRIINIEKLEGVLGDISIEYTDYLDIAKEASDVLFHMNRVEWEKEPFDSIVIKFSNFLSELWKIHPFREGNTRTIVTFCCLFIEAQGIYIESELFKDNAAYMRNALVAANANFHDLGDLRKPEYLYKIVEDALTQGHMMKECICERIVSAGFSPTNNMIHEIVLWNRKNHTEHTSEEIKIFLSNFL